MSLSLSPVEKSDLILKNEKRFCHRVSEAILDKPKLTVWMILIPVFFIFYFWQLKRYSQGRKDFANNFLITRERALDAACEAVAGDMDIEVDKLVQAEDIQEETRPQYRNWLVMLTKHYQSLILSKGDSYQELIRSSYRNHSNYRRFITHLNQVEQEYDAQLQPHLDIESVNDIIKRIETITARLRQQELREIFS